MAGANKLLVVSLCAAVRSPSVYFEPSPVAHNDPAPVAANKALPLKHVEAIRYARAANAEIGAYLVMLDEQLVANQPVVTHQKPPADAPFDRVSQM
jgi:hypothetical protein